MSVILAKVRCPTVSGLLFFVSRKATKISLSFPGQIFCRDQPLFFRAGEPFDLGFSDEGFGTGETVFLVKQFDRAVGSGVGGALALVVFFHAGGNILGDAGVERSVHAPDQVDTPLPLSLRFHSLQHPAIRWVQRGRCFNTSPFRTSMAPAIFTNPSWEITVSARGNRASSSFAKCVSRRDRKVRTCAFNGP
jgi:hypothetical protein